MKNKKAENKQRAKTSAVSWTDKTTKGQFDRILVAANYWR
jgi:uncharacterized GH25 family protein